MLINNKTSKYVPKLQGHFVKYCDNFPNICPMYIFSSDMISQPYEDNFQLFSVAKQKNLGGKMTPEKFRFFEKFIFMLKNGYSQNPQPQLRSNMYIFHGDFHFCALSAHPKTPDWPFSANLKNTGISASRFITRIFYTSLS